MTEPNRRRFLSRAAGLTAAGAIAALTRPAQADPLDLPIGLQLYTVGDDMDKDAAATVRRVAQIGYKEVETAGFGSAGTAPALRRILDDNGLKCPSAHLTFDLKNLGVAFDQAHALGCRYATASVPRMLVMHLPSLDSPGADRAGTIKKIVAALGTPMTADEVKRLVAAMNQVGAAAKKQGLLFASHNHTYEFEPINGKPALNYMMEHTDPENVKFEIDCGWASVAGYNPVDLVNAWPGRVRMLHIKDFLPFKKGAVAGGPNSPKGSEIGRGVVDYKKILAGMRGKGIEHLFVEQEGPYSRMPAIQAAEVDYKYLHSLS